MASGKEAAAGLAVTALAGLISRSSSAEQPPSASFNWSPSNPIVGDTVSLDAAPSEDPDGDIVSYEWDIQAQTLTGEAIEFDVSQAGAVTIQLTVTDNDGNIDSTISTINIQEPEEDPIASFEWFPTDPEQGEQVSLNGGVSSDPDGQIVGYEWNIEGQIINGQSVTFTPNQSGDIQVGLEVTDNDGNTATTTSTITVSKPDEYRWGFGENGHNGYGGPG